MVYESDMKLAAAHHRRAFASGSWSSRGTSEFEQLSALRFYQASIS